MNYSRLRAKSGPETLLAVWLPVHLRDVHRESETLLHCTGDEQLSAVGLNPDIWRDRFHRIVLLAAAVHDLGKANDHFQALVWRTRPMQSQGLRHEWVSALIIDKFLKEWLRPAVGNDDDWAIVIWTVTGHHPAYNRASPPKQSPDGSGGKMQLMLGHNDFAECLNWIQKAFQLSAPPQLQDTSLMFTGNDDVFNQILQSLKQSEKIWKRIQREEPDVARLAAICKPCLIGGDIAGSALAKTDTSGNERRKWIEDAFANRPSAERLGKIVDRRRGENQLREFQIAVGQSTAPVTFVRAGCGSGKTLAAYHWAAQQYPTRRLYFCYPTTGTATEGFRDYLYAPEEDFDAALFHSRASVDLEMIVGVNSAEEESADEAAIRIESLAAWSTPIVSCTVDVVLGIVQNSRRGLYSWPALAGAALIFDEIHAFDDRLFGALLRFLEAVRGVPVLLMTASLPSARLTALAACVARNGHRLATIQGPVELEGRMRYQRSYENELAMIKEELQSGGQVLWVCNTVNRAMEAATKSAKLGFSPLIYHSRFRYEDRVERHKAVIQAFSGHTAALALCTQVAEMSLDLSASLLVTDLAPIAALIQRLGRLNRRAEDGDPLRLFIIIEPENPAPYSREELELAKRWLEALGNGPLSQRDLIQAWEAFRETSARTLLVESAWLGGGPRTEVKELRDSSPGITVIWEPDAEAVRRDPQLLTRRALPMPPPKSSAWRQWKTIKGMPVAPKDSIDYDPKWGARWAE